MAARRVASELGEKLGETVGYQVRFEEVAGPRTRLRFLTEGVLNRRLLSDPELRGVNVVVLDEFHERHLDGDVALALLDRLRRTRRPDLRVVAMSATLDGDAVSRYLDGCPVVRAEGRLHAIAIEYRPHSPAPLEEQVATALETLLSGSGNLEGDVLVFLPGAAEIRRAMRSCAGIAARTGRDLLPLHGDLSSEEQDRAVLPGPRAKVILSTNVAESSLTIEGITAVIDSGVARIAKDSPWTGLPSVEVARISKASAEQRAGRAGRRATGSRSASLSAGGLRSAARARNPGDSAPRVGGPVARPARDGRKSLGSAVARRAAGECVAGGRGTAPASFGGGRSRTAHRSRSRDGAIAAAPTACRFGRRSRATRRGRRWMPRRRRIERWRTAARRNGQVSRTLRRAGVDRERMVVRRPPACTNNSGASCAQAMARARTTTRCCSPY